MRAARNDDAISPEQHASIQTLQRDVLEAVATGMPLAETMDLLCRHVEAIEPDLICTVLLVDPSGHVHPCAAPSLPPEFNASVDGQPIGPKAGSCGTAAFLGEHVEVVDIATDPLWDDYRALALPLGLRACWSSPVKGRDGTVVATFAVYYREPRRAPAFHRQMVDACVHLCTLAIQNEEARTTIHRLAYYDQLTGLPNRTLMGDRAQVALFAAQRDGEALTVMFIDIDRFKMINDSLGHSAGDRFLQEVARRLQAIVPSTDTVCRLGGDEFGLLLLRIDAAEAADIADRLIAVLREPIHIGGVSLTANASVGISIYPNDAKSFETLLRNAEVAMYQAKAAGRNCFHFFRRELHEAATQRLELESAIRLAIAHGELVVHYQPQIDLVSRTLYGAEALVRWNHPQWGLVAPDRFIPLAEECGLINDIDAWVLNEACRQLAVWDRAGIVVPALAVNISATDFSHDKVPRMVADTLARHNIPGERLVLEITERLMLMHNESTQLTFSALRSMGVRISVDDFGTGYSSLGYLKRFPVSELKLDRSFVNDLEHDSGDQALATAVIRIGHALGLTVIAEGVETMAQLDFLGREQCHVAQGFLFGKPLAPHAFTEWVGANVTSAALRTSHNGTDHAASDSREHARRRVGE